MLVEAIEIIRELHTGDLITYVGEHFRVDSARIWDVPDSPVEIGVAVSGEEGIEAFAPLADHLIAVEPQVELVKQWDDARGTEGAEVAEPLLERMRALG